MTNNEQRITSNADTWPPVTCLTPTYGRFERLRDAVACFLLQDYPGPREMIVLNDAAEPLRVGPGVLPGVQVVNAPGRFPNLGAKRQALLENAGALGAPLVAHWDDDDLYLPWHLKDAVSALMGAPGTTCAKSRCGWWALGRRECWELQGGVHHNAFEGQMVFERERALGLGGYPAKMSGQAADLLAKFRKAGELAHYRPADRDVSYVYRWADGLGHVSGCPGRGDDRRAAFWRKNADFGLGRDGKPHALIPGGDPLLWARARLAGQFRILSEQLRTRLSAEDWTHVHHRLHHAVEAPREVKRPTERDLTGT